MDNPTLSDNEDSRAAQSEADNVTRSDAVARDSVDDERDDDKHAPRDAQGKKLDDKTRHHGMHRINGIDESRTDYWVTYNQGLSSTEDQYLPVEERRNRIEVIVGSNLRRGDDVMYLGSIPLRVIGPGPGATSIAVYNPHIWGDALVQLALEELEHLTDRAPIDTAEEPMPIFSDELREVHKLRKQGKAGQPAPRLPRTREHVFAEFRERQPPDAQQKLEGYAEFKPQDPRDSRDAYTTLHEGTRQRPPTKSGPGNQEPGHPSNADHLPQPGVEPDGQFHEDLQSKNLEAERTKKLSEHEVQNEAATRTKPERGQH